jgi:hypothetical protein
MPIQVRLGEQHLDAAAVAPACALEVESDGAPSTAKVGFENLRQPNQPTARIDGKPDIQPARRVAL